MIVKSNTRNTVQNMMSSVLTMLFPMVTVPYVSRILGPEYMGKIDYIQAIIAYFVFFASMGIPLYGNREISKVKNDIFKRTLLFSEIIIFLLFMTVLMLCLYFSMIYFFPEMFHGNVFLAIVLSGLIIANVFDLKWYIQGIGEFQFITWALTVSRILHIGAIFLFVHDKEDLIFFAASIVVSTLISSAFIFYFIKKTIDFSLVKFADMNIFRHMKFVGWFFFSQIAILIYTNLDKVMLGYYHGDESVGQYFSASKLNMILLMFVSSTSTVFLAKFSELNKNGGTEEILYFLKKSISLSFFLSVPAIAYILIMAPGIINIIFGASYTSQLTLKILSLLLLFIGLNNVFGVQVLLSAGKEKLFAGIVLVGAIANFTLNVFFIPAFSYNGAATSTVIAEFIILVIEYFVVNKMYPNFFNFKELNKTIISSILLAMELYLLNRIMFYFIDSKILTFFIVSLLGGLSYALFLLYTKNDFFLWVLKDKLKIIK